MPRVPLSWLGEWVELPAGVAAEQVAADLVRVGLEEEEITPPQVTGPLVVGRVVSIEPEPQKNGKTINWCRVDVGPLNEEDGSPRGIVCGAHNFVVDDLVVVALPGAVLPGPFPISSRKTYGHVSDGMICSARELGLGDDHTGIIVLSALGIDVDHGYSAATVQPGADAITLLGLDDSIVEINVTPDRGYCFAIRGVAREYSLSTGAAFTDPGLGATPAATDDGPAVAVDDPDGLRGRVGCDRFAARVVRGVAAASPSPWWMQQRLINAGMRPISLAVDVTNYVMLELGQPMHAYDLAAVHLPLVVRRGRPGETVRTLDEVLREVHPEDLLITDSGAGDLASRPLALAGVMGGAESEIADDTTDLLLEAAHFDQVTVARTSRRHRLASEASRRFERGVDPALPLVAIQRAVDLLVTYGGGEADLAITDVDHRSATAPVVMTADTPTRIVGVEYSPAQVRDVLEAVGCDVQGETDLVVTPPTWRPDLTADVDLVEEVARLVGYDAIPSVLPPAPAGGGLTAAQRSRRSVARALAERGFVEVLSSPFVPTAIHDDFGLDPADPRRRSVRVVNPLQETEPELRTSVLASLVGTLRRNIVRGFSDVALFEAGAVMRAPAEATIAPTFLPGHYPGADGVAAVLAAVPEQPASVAGIACGRWQPDGWWGEGRTVDHTDAVAAARLVFDRLGANVQVRNTDYAPWHPGRCAEFSIDGQVVGHAGELHPDVLRRLELPARAVAFEINLAAVGTGSGEPIKAVPVSSFPVAKEDVALVVAETVPAGDLLEVVRAAAGELVEDVRVFDVFTGPQVGEGRKSVAFGLRLRAADRTLTAEETTAVREAIVAAAGARFGAELRS